MLYFCKNGMLPDNVLEQELTQSSIKGYSWKEELITYADIKQRWLLLESQKTVDGQVLFNGDRQLKNGLLNGIFKYRCSIVEA